ncbi:endolytic transglycosylase MltG [Psychrobacter sp. I-STPA6b]|uniref:endolytic transglycosylase MltG n=1 Tax=Psychrobacter sp. I-STPA6b TaxID=2585718 RepID=UPI001D0CBC35|nr:endolytic transglycosylase MltG [Psychrobacter sp. I-STPA6b]
MSNQNDQIPETAHLSNNDTSKAIASSTKPESKDSVPVKDSTLICEGKPRKYRKDDVSIFAKRSYQLLLVFGLMLLFLAVMTYQTLFGHLTQPAQKIEVSDGDTYYGLLPQFQGAVPLFSATLAKFYIKTQVNTPLNAGTYELPENPSLMQMLNVLEAGEQIALVQIQIIEGKTAQDLYHNLANTSGVTLEVLDEQGRPKMPLKQALGIDAYTPEGEFVDNLEGWFSPNTYHYAEGTTDKQILADLYQIQQQALDEAWASRAENLPYKTPYEALIMASIIEKETGIASERPLVSAVFVNRLNQGMRLQTDPTIIYGMGERYDGNIRRKDINEATAYNTYQIDGLPPTPIALPSKASIEAALHPADSDALYFVATGTGGHKFSKTLAEHNRAVQEYLKVIRQQSQ